MNCWRLVLPHLYCRVYRFFRHSQEDATVVRGMVTELVHSNCYQMRRGHPGGVPLSVVCPVALQACTFLAGLHAAGECHGNISIRAMGLQVGGQGRATVVACRAAAA